MEVNTIIIIFSIVFLIGLLIIGFLLQYYFGIKANKLKMSLVIHDKMDKAKEIDQQLQKMYGEEKEKNND